MCNVLTMWFKQQTASQLCQSPSLVFNQTSFKSFCIDVIGRCVYWGLKGTFCVTKTQSYTCNPRRNKIQESFWCKHLFLKINKICTQTDVECLISMRPFKDSISLLSYFKQSDRSVNSYQHKQQCSLLIWELFSNCHYFS